MPNAKEFQPAICYDLTAVITIANSTTVSAAVDLNGTTLVGIVLPAALTGTAITFQASTSLGGTYTAVNTAAGAAYSLTVAASKWILIPPLDLAGLQFIKLVSGSAEGADRIIGLVTRRVGA